MMLPQFHYHRPQTVDHALALLAEHGEEAALLAGGVEVLNGLKMGALSYGHLVDLKGIAALRGIEKKADTIVIGALSTHRQIAADPLIFSHYPAYAALHGRIGNVRVRGAGTVGGNLCFAEPHAEPPVMLSALGARAVLDGPDGRRALASEDWFSRPGVFNQGKAELLVALELPLPGRDFRCAYSKFNHLERTSASIALAVSPDPVPRWSIWCGAISHRPVRLAAIETALAGIGPSHAWEAASPHIEAVTASLEAWDDIYGGADYKRHLVSVMFRRAIDALMADQNQGKVT